MTSVGQWRAMGALVALFALVALSRVGRSSPETQAAPFAVDAGAPDAGVPKIVDAVPDAGPPESEGARALREGRPMDLNTATASDLELLPRIGPATAARIVEDRRRRGPFRHVGSLRRVRGIGPRTVAGLRHLVTVAPP